MAVGAGAAPTARPTQLLSLNRREALHPRWNKILFGFGAKQASSSTPLSLSVGARVKRREEGGSPLVWRSHNLTKCAAGFFVPRYRSERAAGGNSSKSPFIVGPFVLPLPSICRQNEAQRERDALSLIRLNRSLLPFCVCKAASLTHFL